MPASRCGNPIKLDISTTAIPRQYAPKTPPLSTHYSVRPRPRNRSFCSLASKLDYEDENEDEGLPQSVHHHNAVRKDWKL